MLGDYWAFGGLVRFAIVGAMDDRRRAVIDQARSYLGTPWRHQGRSRRGLDCVGLLVMVCRDLGISDYDESGYERLAKGRSLINAIEARCRKVTQPQPGDVLCFRYDANPQHVGIATDHPHGGLGMIHANARAGGGLALSGRVNECRFATPWPERLVAAFELPAW